MNIYIHIPTYLINLPYVYNIHERMYGERKKKYITFFIRISNDINHLLEICVYYAYIFFYALGELHICKINISFLTHLLFIFIF